MMTSYLCIVLPLESVSQDCLPDLAHLVRLSMASVTLDVQPLADALLPEGVMTATNPFNESQTQEERAQIVEANVRVRWPLRILSRNLSFGFVMASASA